MKTLLIIAIIVLLIILIMIFPMRARAQGYINVGNGLILYSLKILFIKLLVGRINVNYNGADIENDVNLIDLQSEPTKYDYYFIKALLKKIKIAKLNLIYNVGLVSPSSTAITSGGLYSVSLVLSTLVLGNNPNADIFISTKPNFKKYEFEMIVQLTIKISILKILICVLKAKKEFNICVKKENKTIK